MTAPLTFVVPMPPNLANRPMHHMVKHHVKVGYWALLDLMYGHGYDMKALAGLNKVEQSTTIQELRTAIACARRVSVEYLNPHPNRILDGPEQAPARWPKASIRSVMHLGKAMDAGNAMNRHKWVEDWLTTRGYIADDRTKCLTWEGLPEQVVKRDGNYRIELVLTPLEAR